MRSQMGAGGGHAGILVVHGLTDNDYFVLWPIGGSIQSGNSHTANTEELCAQAFQAEERRDQSIDIFEAVVERQGWTYRGLDPKAA
jgi:hypothetical protein